jgi:hypothetical protein
MGSGSPAYHEIRYSLLPRLDWPFYVLWSYNTDLEKLWNNRHDPKSVEKSLDDSLKELGVDYVDLYLMHWPSPFKDGEEKMPKDNDGKVIPGDTDYVDT